MPRSNTHTRALNHGDYLVRNGATTGITKIDSVSARNRQAILLRTPNPTTYFKSYIALRWAVVLYSTVNLPDGGQSHLAGPPVGVGREFKFEKQRNE